MKLYIEKLISLANAPATREIPFGELAPKDRLATLYGLGFGIKNSKSYPVARRIRVVDNAGKQITEGELCEQLTKPLRRSSDREADAHEVSVMLQKFRDGLFKKESDMFVTYHLLGEDLSESQRCDAMCRENGITMETMVEEDVFAGKNLYETLAWVRGLEPAVFEAIFNKGE